jgi:hypothetical protein
MNPKKGLQSPIELEPRWCSELCKNDLTLPSEEPWEGGAAVIVPLTAGEAEVERLGIWSKVAQLEGHSW